jgi:Zn-dependent peptidase ImmA (M78 family)
LVGSPSSEVGSPSSEKLPHHKGARRALELRSTVDLTHEPIRDLWSLVRDRGVNLGFHDFGPLGGDGLYRWNGETALIAANSSLALSRLRQRFTVAHELGHHVMHRTGEAPLLIADKDIFGRRDPVEQEANAFAGHLLMPNPAIDRALDAWQVDQLDPTIIAELMQHFGVSYEVAVFRLHNANRINAGTRDALLEAKRQIGVRQICEAIGFNEFLEYPLPNALPAAFESDVLRAFAARAITVERLTELLRAPSVEVAVAHARNAGISPDVESAELTDEEFETLLGG